ncbi:MAG: enoyl-CoA hydratase/isomerase family protein [Candidatus Schekmanbacteria bacterium]|nr:enoyl-CoA hydratase/isomerase family protein [Candidatus Schekmanbacteria bacterium]
MSSETVLLEIAAPRATITLNRPEKRNAINRAMLAELEPVLMKVRDDATVRVVVLCGAGPAFCSGIDHALLAEISAQCRAGVPFRHLHGDLHRCLDVMVTMEKPVVALLHGVATGMGLELALAADFRIAPAACVIGLPEVAFGLIPDVGGTTRLTRLVGGHRAKELILTGVAMTAAAAPAGLMTRVAADEEAAAEELERLVAALSRHPALAVGLGKALVDRVADCDEATAKRLEGVYQTILLQQPEIAQHFPAAVAFIQDQIKNPRR